jgi:hypothetical protein
VPLRKSNDRASAQSKTYFPTNSLRSGLMHLRNTGSNGAYDGSAASRRLNAAGFSFAVVERGDLLLPFKAMLFSERASGQKSGSPPLLAPSLKFQRNIAHNQSSGFAVAPGVKGLNARGPLKVQSERESYRSFGAGRSLGIEPFRCGRVFVG